jgi:hypothetical protein
MDGLSNLVGEREQYFTIGGVTYTLTVFKLDDFAARERYILALRSNPFEALRHLPKDSPPEAFREVAEVAMREWRRGQFVTDEEDREFVRSMHGRAYDFWKAAQPRHPEIDSLQKAVSLIERGLFEEGKLAEFELAIQTVKEADILGNSAPPANQSSPPTREPGGVDGGCTGPRSTASSSPSTDSAPATSDDSRFTGPL